ncbi:hypothetical protein F4810DRAFT_404215 [Camillea tinctor]|nr:hypothetical protein F4810DRAFT_404215 [Camillea tinctor]
MKYLAIALSFIPLAFASWPAPAGPWTASARHIPSDAGKIIEDSLQASGGHFWMGKSATPYCPSDVANLDCSLYNGTDTVLIGGNNTIFLDVTVPGGQQMYIASDGALSYSVPHSLPPAGAITTGFWREGSEGFMGAVFFGHEGSSAYACPVEDEEDVYQIFLGTEFTGCYGVLLFTYTFSGATVWEYS